jgi:hypothetical protein
MILREGSIYFILRVYIQNNPRWLEKSEVNPSSL